MSNERVVICGGLVGGGGPSKKREIPLQLWGEQRNVNLKISDLTKAMTANVPSVLVDLLEIATYVYCADQVCTRGAGNAANYGAKWRRQFRFRIPVREPDLWSSDPVDSSLRDAVSFLSDDEYEFEFTHLKNPPPIEKYLDFGSSGDLGTRPDEVMLFSGGLDSLAGAVQTAAAGKRSVALVSHRSAPTIANRQKNLLIDLGKRCAQKPLRVPVWINKDEDIGGEYTQRSRSFLYAALGAIVARMLDLWKIRFYENGVISMNLPISPQVIGGRATRTTHPQVLNGFSDFFTTLFQRPFAIENPFLWMTKAEVVRSIRDAGCADLIKNSVSCTHVWMMTTEHSHCGTCSQCIDRRFATLSAGCSDEEDPEEMYAVDLLRGERERGDSRTMLESYVRTARRVKEMSDAAFFSEFGEAHRITHQIRGVGVDQAGRDILNLYKRHSAGVCDVIAKGIQAHAQEVSEGKVPSTSLLILALPDEYKRPASYDDVSPSPVLILDEIKGGDANPGLLARVVGAARFDGVNKRIGSRELFFFWLLFASNRTHDVDGERLTVVTEADAAQTLLAWDRDGYLRFSGKDRAKPAHRVLKMWREFVRQIEKDPHLKKLFTSDHKDLNGDRLYGLRLSPPQKQIRLPNIAAVFERAKE